jgi:hypothetical protein
MGKELGVTIALEVISALAGLMFDLARREKLTPVQIEQAFARELQRFIQNDPFRLPDVDRDE